MKTYGLVSAWVLSLLMARTQAYPGAKYTLDEIRDLEGDEDTAELIGDLLTTPKNQWSPVGAAIAEILVGDGDAESSETYVAPGKLKTAKCKADPCCLWKWIADEMYEAFVVDTGTGKCTKWARYSVRMGFHDAGTWSKFTGPTGGADGSIILSGVEMSRPENKGLEEMADKMAKWYAKYSPLGAGMADLIQMAATVGAVACPLGPRVRSFVGRIDSSTPAPDGLLPPADGTAPFLVSLFENKTIPPHDLVALVGAHTTSRQRNFDPTKPKKPQDSTPGVWDVLFYGQTLGTVATPKKVVMFPSDIALSKYSRTAGEFAEFAGSGGQHHWNEDYAKAYVRLSLLGVNNINSLTECSKVLPMPVTSFP